MRGTIQSQVVKGCVDAFRGECADAHRKVRCVVINGFNPNGPQCVVVSRRGGTDDPDSTVQSNLTENRADAAVGPMNQDGLARLDARFAVEHLPCRDAID